MSYYHSVNSTQDILM